MTRTIGDLSVVFLGATALEERWEDLRTKCPSARRLGSNDPRADVYAAAAVRATSPHFITVEPDCLVDEAFFSSTLPEGALGDNSVLIWPARNIVNDLCYAHGAIRCWPRALALSRSRKNPRAKRGEIKVPMPAGYATHHINTTPDRAFGHGFREGARLSTHNGRRVARDHAKILAEEHYRRLLTWLSAGADIKNGLWAIYGARLGCKMANLGALDLEAARDSDWLTAFWQDEVAPLFRGTDVSCERTGYGWDSGLLANALAGLGTELQERLNLPLGEL